MKNIVFVFVVAFAFCTMAMASDIAFYVGQWNTDGWYDESQFEDVETIIAETGVLFKDIQQFDDEQFDEFGAWVDERTNNGVMDIIWLNGCMPSVLYQFPNVEPDGSRAEEWLDGGNMIINVGDWFGYMSYEGGSRSADNGPSGAANILDLSSDIIVSADNTSLTVTPTGQEYLPSLNDPAVTYRPVVLAEVQAPWEVAAIFASSGGTDAAGAEAQADPVVIHNTETGGYVAFINQAAGGPTSWIDDRGLTCAEFIGNWVNNVVGLGDLPLAMAPNPKDGVMLEDTWANLSWRAGDFAASHDVYLGDNFDDVNNGAAETFQGNQATTSLTIGFPGFAYPDGLIRGKTYYWRIDEVNDTEPNSPWKGNVWSFKIANYLVVDDFEDYNDYPPDEIFSTWIDGYDVATNGALVGNDTYPFAEQSIVHSGAQSMPYFYDNSGAANYSEAERTFSPAQDWTRESVKVLSLWFRGYPAYMGSFVEGPTGTFTMTAEGVDIWDTSDQFHFAYKELSGAGTIIAKVESVENTNEWAKAGVMIRDTLDADSSHAMMVVTPTSGVSFQRRTPAGASSSDTTEAGITAPQWVKLERTIAGFIRASYSADGSTWTQLGSQTVTMSTPMYIGLALTSHNSGVACEAKFSNVSFPGTTVGQQWTNLDIGITSNDAEPMYVVLNGSAMVTHDNPNATQIDEWTEWTIDLQAFAEKGVNLASIDTIALGLGDETNPQAGGTGKMYFDDIRLYRLAEQAP